MDKVNMCVCLHVCLCMAVHAFIVSVGARMSAHKNEHRCVPVSTYSDCAPSSFYHCRFCHSGFTEQSLGTHLDTQRSKHIIHSSGFGQKCTPTPCPFFSLHLVRKRKPIMQCFQTVREYEKYRIGSFQPKQHFGFHVEAQ